MRNLLNIIENTGGPGKADIIGLLTQLGYEESQLKVSGNKIYVMAQLPDGSNRSRSILLHDIKDAIQQAVPQIKPEIFTNDPGFSSIGGIKFYLSPVKVGVKDAGKQGGKSAGVANEMELAMLLDSVVQAYGSAHVTFIDPTGKTLGLNNVNKVDVSGRTPGTQKTGGVQKADVVLSSPGGNLPISIKKVDAEAWESGEGSFGDKAAEIVAKLDKKGIIKLERTVDEKGRTNYKLDKEIVIEPTEEEAMKAIFGTDLNPKGGIVIQTFLPQHFVQEENKVTVHCHAIIKNKADIPESHLMVWLIRNGAGRWPSGYRGLRPMGVVLTRALGRHGNKDVILVDKDGNVLKGSAASTGTPALEKPKARAKRVEPAEEPRQRR